MERLVVFRHPHNKERIGRIIAFVDVSDRVYAEEKLQLSASMDGLTQVYNRTHFMKRSGKAYR
ncbi:hypothetical protein [Peribacillus kribbensis]|uniref:hypothetical protein n=1 Tax=Peribacillus kribbensis TaxID=356658 RepID=UPI00041B0D2A|nr:hypothetical protein [Peribacillus kribbensis]